MILGANRICGLRLISSDHLLSISRPVSFPKSGDSGTTLPRGDAMLGEDDDASRIAKVAGAPATAL